MEKAMSRISISLLLALVLIIGCSIGNRVGIESISPQGEVEKLTSLKIEFDKPLAPVDKQNIWLDEQYIEFQPKLSGKFKWLSASILVFSPDASLEPMQKYKGKISDKVLFGTNLSADFDEIEFASPSFKPLEVELYWTMLPHKNFTASVQADISFTYPVSADQLRKYLKVIHDGNDVQYSISTNGSSDILSINLGEVKQTEKEQNFSFIIKEGLMSTLGKQATGEEIKFEKELPPITELEIRDATAGFDGLNGWIEVRTSQKIDEDALSRFVFTEPVKILSHYVSDNSFRLETELTPDRLVTLKIKKGLPGLYGGELKEDYEQVLSMVEITPSINFTDRTGKYLMLSGQKNLEISAVNLSSVEVEVSQIFKNNITHFANSIYDEGFEDYGYDYNPYYYVGNYGKSLYKKQIDINTSQNWIEKFTINLDSAIKLKQKGIYVVTVTSADDLWLQDAKVVAITDLAIIAKMSQSGLMVFVNSIESTEPVEGVEINLISTNNQTLLTGKTDNDGVLQFKDIRAIIGDFVPKVITAEKGDDFNYISLTETQIDKSRFDVGGMNEISDSYTAFIYSERNLYRPGETVHLSSIVRNDKIELTNQIPVITRITSPTGKIFDEYKTVLNDEGSFELAVRLPTFAQTGEYTASILTGTDEPIGFYKFSVEEFIPDKIRVNLKTGSEFARPGQSVNVDIDAEFLFGAKAAGLRYEANIQIKPVSFKSKTFPSHNFNNSPAEPITITDFMEGMTDGNGWGQVVYTIPADLPDGSYTADFYITVTDITGRPVNRYANIKVFPQDFYIGIKSPGYYFSTNSPISFNIATVDMNDKPFRNARVVAKLVRFEWQTILKKSYEDKHFYSSEEKEIVEWEKTVNISGGEENLKVIATKSGKHELRISQEGAISYQRYQFYSYSWASSSISSFQVDKEGRIDILTDKKSYEPGDRAKILFTTPFAGRMLVTIERNGIYDYRYIDVEKRSAQLDLPITESYLPNVYVTATLFRKHGTDLNTPFFVGHGFAPIVVEKKKNKLSVAINAPKKIKPNSRQYIEVRTNSEKDIYVTLALVDEGILQLKNYRSPDPYSYMYARRSLKVESYDLYKLLLPEIISSSTGGGDEAMFDELRQKRTNPITTKRVNLLSFWSGIVKTNSSGVVKIPVDIPQFNGEARIMAVAYKGSRFGSAESFMKISDDIIIEPEIPRFLTVNDKLIAPVTLINTSSKTGRVKVTMNTEGALKVTSSTSFDLDIPANSSRQATFNVLALQQAGYGKITIQTEGLAKVKEEINISVSPGSPYSSETGSGSIVSGKEVNISFQNGYMKGTSSSSVSISKFPAIKFAKQLRNLIGYPYGCIEQTISKLFPMIYYADLAKLVSPETFKINTPVYYIREGIEKIESMQLYDGSLSYWEGSGTTSWWGSIYGAHFLIESKKAGFEVSESVLRRLLSYFEKQARQKSEYEYVYFENGTRSTKKVVNKEIPYSLYVLALAGRADISTMNYYKARLNTLSMDSRYLLAGAFAHSGRWSSYSSILPATYTPESALRTTGGSFDSEIRANALMLNVMLEINPSGSQIPVMIKQLSSMIKDSWSTQENAWAFLALGKAAKLKKSGNTKVDVYANGKLVKSYTGNDIRIDSKDYGSANLTLKASGGGEVYYFWTSQGVKSGVPIKEFDSYMKVRREYIDYRTGKKIQGSLTQGQLIQCDITLTGLNFSAENIVISDIVPAGFEIENPRLSAISNLVKTSDNHLDVQYMDVRDDRILLFTNLIAGSTRKFSYLIRVTNQGEFRLPPISAEAMYSPEINSVNGSGWIKVLPRSSNGRNGV